MKRGLWVSVFVFSIAINLAVGGTLLWNLWRAQTSSTDAESAPALTRDDLRVITAAWPSDNQATMRETAEKLRQKKLEILELMTRNPGDVTQAQPKIDELIALRGQMERQALLRIGSIMGQLPQENRKQFFQFLQNRTCMGMGAGLGPGSCPRCGGMMGPGRGRGYLMHEKMRQQQGSTH